MNGNLLRTALDWRHAEPQRDQWSQKWWGRWQSFYEEATARGITIIFRVGMAPQWARDPEYQDCVGLPGLRRIRRLRVSARARDG